MPQTIKASEARTNFGQVLKRVHRGEERLIVEKGGLPVAAIIGLDDLEKLFRLEKLEQFDQFSRAFGTEVARRGLSEKELLKELEKIQQEVFKERYGSKAKTS